LNASERVQADRSSQSHLPGIIDDPPEASGDARMTPPVAHGSYDVILTDRVSYTITWDTIDGSEFGIGNSQLRPDEPLRGGAG
jgi:hypothetical protein